MDDEVAKLISKKFIQRPGVKAVQHNNGAYIPVTDDDGNRLPFKMRDLRDHLAGTKTFGHYLLDENDNCKLFAYDIDLVNSWTPKPTGTDLGEWKADTWTPEGLVPISPRKIFHDANHPLRERLIVELRCIAAGLAACVARLLDIPTAIAYSGSKGLHVYCFTGPNTSAADARGAALDVLLSTNNFEATRGENFFRHTNDPRWGYPHVEIEVFPKQESLGGKDLGNLMRLPLGIHRKSKQHGFFLDAHAPDNVLAQVDAMSILEKGISWA